MVSQEEPYSSSVSFCFPFCRCSSYCFCVYTGDILIVLFLNMKTYSVDKRRKYSLDTESGGHGRDTFLNILSLYSSAFCSFEATSICAALKSAVAM